MNDLAMGPLPAKRKTDEGKTVFRCGVRDCPEVLATSLSTAAVTISIGYARNSNGDFIKTRHAATRYRDERQERKHGLWGAYGTRGADVMKARDDYRSTKSDPTPSVETMVLGFQLPIIIKCARCGRLSKIEGAG